jgi:hypothetical protein
MAPPETRQSRNGESKHPGHPYHNLEKMTMKNDLFILEGEGKS